MSSPGYGSIGNNGSGSNNNHNRDNSLHKRSSFFGGHKPSLEDSRPSTSNTAAGTEDYFQTGLGGGEGATTTGAAVDEKTQRNTTHDPNDNDGIKKEENDMHHHGHQHEPGESCSVPHMMQSMLSDQQHDIVETVVIKVRDSADVTQKTIFYFWDEWKLFVNRGNVIDLGIGVVIGGAFSDIIDSFVSDILTPPLSLWAYGTNLENSFFVLRPGKTPGKKYATYLEAQADGAVTENTGQFFKACLNFLFIAFFLFWLVKAVHNIRKEKIRPPPKEKTCNWCKEQIALDAFRCKFCQSFVKDIPGLKDASVGMFVTVKKPRLSPKTSTVSTPAAANGGEGNNSPAGTGTGTAAGNSSMGPADGKKVADALKQMESP